jgi:prepilin-type N-terminal cleavage/methylation domain-containing protein
VTPHVEHPRSQSGFTLVEVMVAISILSLLMVLLTTTIVHGMRLSSGMSVRLDNINQGQLGMNAATKSLRTAVLPDQLADNICVPDCGDAALTFAAPNEVTFYANLNNTGEGPSLMSYYIEAGTPHSYGNLIQETRAPQDAGEGAYSFCDVVTPGCVTKRVVTRGLKWPVDLTATPVFKYYDFNGEELLTPGTLDDYNLARVSSIDITLTVQTSAIRAAPSNTIVQRVQLPNAAFNVLKQEE